MKHNWEYKKLGEVCDVQNGFAFKSQLFKNEGNPILRISNIQNGVIVEDDTVFFTPDDYDVDFERYIVEKNDIVIAMSGATTGKVGINKTEHRFYLNQRVGLFRENKEKIQHLYLYYFLQTQAQDALRMAEGLAQPNLSTGQIKDFRIPVPPLPTQQSIVSELDSLSKIIADCKETLKDYDALEQSIFYDMFGDPVKNEKGWEVREMGSICEVTSFKRVLIEDVVDEGIPFVRGTELTEMCGLTRGEQMKFSLFITQEHYERVKKITGVPSVGDLLIPSINSKGYVWIVDTTEPMYYKDGRVLWVHINKDFFRSEYLQKTINSILLNSYSLMASGATFAELKLFILRELNIPVPPIELQIQFADKINAIEQMKAETKEALQEAETLFQARMDYWFN